MRLTPLDIRKQEFSRGFRGYDAEEVNAFLQMVANQWEDLQDENRRQEEKIRELGNKLQHYEKVEEALQEALQTARESSRKALQNAEDKAELLIEQAEARADEIKREAERERHELKRESAKLSGRRSEIVSRLRAFLMSEMEMLARYEGDDPVGFIKLLPAEEQRLRRLSDRLEEDESTGTRAHADVAGTSSESGESTSTDEPDDFGHEAAEQRSYDETASASETRLRDLSDPSREEPPAASQSRETRQDREDGTVHEAHTDDRAAGDADGNDESEREPEDVLEGPGWTARTVVLRPSEIHSYTDDQESESASGAEMDFEDAEEEETSTRASSEEIEKIRRILSDLD